MNIDNWSGKQLPFDSFYNAYYNTDMNKFYFSKRIRNGRTYVSVKNDEATYEQLVKELIGKYPNVSITSGCSYFAVTGVLA